jgi:hypothetical protein
VARGAYRTGQVISTSSFGLVLDYPHELESVVTERLPRKAGVFGIIPEDSSLKMALDEMHVALALLARTTTRR